MARHILVAVLLSTLTPYAAHAEKFKTLHNFGGITNGVQDGVQPDAVTFLKGSLYGTTSGSSLVNGVVFKIDASTGAEEILKTLPEHRGRKSGPGLPLVYQGKVFYALTTGDDDFGGGINKVSPKTGGTTRLYTFPKRKPNGRNPSGAMTFLNGAFYGVASFGGTENAGVVFKFDPSTKAETTVYNFQNSPDGMTPDEGGLVSIGGLLYGTTELGGGNGANCGTLFVVDPATGLETLLYSFKGASGCYPGALTTVDGTTLYGIASHGGASKNGTVFSFDIKSGQLKTLYAFTQDDNDSHGSFPMSTIAVVNGAIYGGTAIGGSADGGVLFSVDIATGAETVLHNFNTMTDGSLPLGIIYNSGALYGVTLEGGPLNYGTAFKYTLPAQ